jgi:N-acetylneuraminate synthase
VRNGRVFVIAEAGVNHNGSLELALELAGVAASAGADAVKFQTFSATELVSARARMADYQVRNTGTERTQLQMLRELELSIDAHHALTARCRDLGIAFMSTPFDVESLRFLSKLDMPAIKISSGDLTAAPLILEAARCAKPLIVSTGMATLEEIEEALGVIAFGLMASSAAPSRAAFAAAFSSADGRAQLVTNVTLLHCVTEYPAPLAEVNLRAMNVLRREFGLRTGYSDHTTGTSVALAAVAQGATVLEKHFTLDRDMAGPDHKAALEPDELHRLVREVREIELALGDEKKEPGASELPNRIAARRSVVAARSIARGEAFSEQNLAVKRPGNGLSPMAYWDLLGRPANKAYAPDDPIEP